MPSSPPEVGFPLKAWVEYTKDASRLNEYQVVNHPKIGGKPAYAECFVECIEGEEFCVKIEFDWSKHKHDIQALFECDGAFVKGTARLRSESKTGVIFDSAYTHDAKSGQNMQHPLKFAKAMTTDDPEGVTPQSQALSSLVVKLREVKYKRSYLGRGSTGDFKDIVVDEKRNKLGSSVTLGSTSTVYKLGTSYRAKDVARGSTFHFVFNQYRTRAKLQTMSIIPPDPVAAPSSSRGSSESDTSTMKEEGNDLTGLDEKPGGIVAYEAALKRIRQLEDDNRSLRANKKKRRNEEVIDLSFSDGE